MAKKRRVTRASAQLPPASSAPVAGVELKAIALRHLEYREIPRSEVFATSQPHPKINIKIDANATINVYEGKLAEFIFDVTVAPDPAFRPVVIRAKIALVVYAPALNETDLQVWLQQVGGFIVYPYIREIVSDVTTRGVYGTLLLDPMPVSSLRFPIPVVP